MKRFAAITILALSFGTFGAAAQPAKPAPKKPAAPKPADPYADPPINVSPPAPINVSPPATIGPAPPPGGVKPKPQPSKPENPYAPLPPVKSPPDPKMDPYAGMPKLDPKAPPRPAPTTQPPKPAGPAPKAPADPYAAIPARIGIADVGAVQGLLAVQRLDGWLLFDRDGANPIARRLVAPDGNPSRPWFYMIPAKGQPIVLCHDSEKRSFEHLPGTKLSYTGYRDLDQQIRVLLKNVKTIAVEYSPKAAVPSVSRVDAGTLEIIRGAGVQVRSSDTLVQYTKAIWGDVGKTAHHVAVHHVVELRKEAFAFITKQLAAGVPVTEYDVQQRLIHGMTMRGLAGPAPVVAAGVNTADPYYVPNAARTATIRRGDLIVVSVAAKLDKPEGIYAAHTWVAVADASVRDDIKKAFETVTLARDQAVAMILDRTKKNRPVTGAEVDQATRAFIKKAGLAGTGSNDGQTGPRVMHRTGHSLDNDFQGGGADLDDFEVKDTRILTPGTGFTVGPGVYAAGNFGVRTEISVFLAPSGPEITTPAQDYIEPLLLK